MYKLLSKYLLVIIASLNVCVVSARTNSSSATTLDELLLTVKEGRNADSEENKKRLIKFTNAYDQQEALVLEAKNETAKLERIGDDLNKTIADLDRDITQLETQLSQRLGNFGELFGVTRQVAGDTRSQIRDSLISAQYPGREDALNKIADGKTLPTMEQLRTLWVALLQEQTEQGKIARFSARVANDQGFPETQDIIRLGAFTAISNDQFLVYNGETRKLTHLAKQPETRYTRSAKRLSSAAPGELVNVSIDPSSGTILSLLVQTPSLLERFHQGGLPGYVVSLLAVIGLGVGLFRLVSLWRIGVGVKKQLKSKTIDINNPLGRVLHTYKENPNLDVEALELKLDDAILKEIPTLDRGLSTVKVLAAVAPLIGLLGTVVGMILTFQAITLWGTGEPKIMAGGISQALVTTVQGLIAAIPLLLLHSVTYGRARLVQQVLEEQSAGLIARRAERAHA